MPLPTTPLLTLLHRARLMILATMFSIAAIVAIRGRGPWYDEMYTYFCVRPAASFDALWPAWLRDNHPPLFYALTWTYVRLLELSGLGHLAATVAGVRTVNVVCLVALLLVFAWLARTSAWFRTVAWFYLLALAALFPVLDRIDQLRSYFLSLALTALVLPGLAIWVQGARTAVHRHHTRVLAVLLLLAFSVHLVTTVIVAGIVGGVLLWLIALRRWRDAGRLTVIAALALIPFGLSMVLQLATIVENTQSFWIPGGLPAARWAIEREVTDACYANPVLGMIALAGGLLLVVDAWHKRGDARDNLALIMALSAGTAIALAVLIAVHLHRPLLITRYLVALDPVVALFLALSVAWLARRLPARARIVLDIALLAGVGWALGNNLRATLAQPSWDGTGAAIAALVRTCPQTRVVPAMRWNAQPYLIPPRDNREVVPFAYDFIARRHGFALAPAHDHAMPQPCPTVFWTEHAASQHPTAKTVIMAMRAAGYPVASGRMLRIGNGWILIARP